MSPHGIVGDLLINDGHHPSLPGHVALAQAVLRELRRREAFGWSRGAAPSIDVAECAAHFGIDHNAWVKICASVATFYNITALIRHDPTERLRKAELYRHTADQIAAGARAGDLRIPGIGVSASRSDAPPYPDYAGVAAPTPASPAPALPPSGP